MSQLNLILSEKATEIDQIFTVDLTLFSKCQIDGEDFVNFFGLLRKLELYKRYVYGANMTSEAHWQFDI